MRVLSERAVLIFCGGGGVLIEMYLTKRWLRHARDLRKANQTYALDLTSFWM